MKPIVIIGTGLAGYMLAKEFRALDANAPLIIITAKKGNFYSKPQLSTALSMKRTPEQLVTVPAAEMAERLNAILHTQTTVTSIDHENNEISFVKSGQQSETIQYSKLVLATGSNTIHPPLQGNAASDIISVNDLEQYEQFRELIADKKRVAVLGAGLVGCEFANDLSNVGYDVTVIAPAPYPVDRLLPQEIATELQQALEQNGVTWCLNTLPQSVDRIDDQYVVQGDNQSVIKADIVMSAIGIVPCKDLAQQSGLTVNRGVIVNRQLQTSAPNVYALGDCAEVNGLVLCYTAPLLKCAKSLAKTLAGEETEVDYPCMPVSLKTPACPIAVQTPPQNINGEWQIDRNEDGLKALFLDENEQLHGFVLTKKRLKERMQLQKDIPSLFSGEEEA